MGNPLKALTHHINVCKSDYYVAVSNCFSSPVIYLPFMLCKEVMNISW